MKRAAKLILCPLLAVILFIGGHTLKAEAASAMPEYYGRNALSKEGDVYALAYDLIFEGVKEREDSIDISAAGLPVDWVDAVYNAVLRDHPELFWMPVGYYYYYNTAGVAHTVKPEYTIGISELPGMKAKFDSRVSELLGKVNGVTDDIEKEHILHDELAACIEYDYAYSSPNMHNAYGALVEGKAVCDGYARAFQYLLQRSGIQSFIATGSSVNPGTGRAEGHAWNYVRLGGEYYHVDLTWDDQGDQLYHNYLNVSDEMILEDHVIEEAKYELPVCDSEDAFYFNLHSSRLADGYDVDDIANIVKKGDSESGFYVDGSVSQFCDFVQANKRDIAKKLGLYGQINFSANSLGHEVKLIIEAHCDHSSLTKKAKKAATCTAEGNIEYYVCPCGKWFEDKNAKTEITDKNSVKIPALGHDYSERLEDAAHIRTKAEKCTEHDTYWYDCSRCSASAKNDASANNKYYEGSTVGSHKFTEKLEDGAHLVKGTGVNCLDAKEYYYDCAYCNTVGDDIWVSDSFGEHDYSKEYSSDKDGHYYKCALCDAEKGREKHTSSSPATETEPEVCDKCGYIITPELGHTTHKAKDEWQSDATDHWNPCTGCTEVQLNKAPHEYDNACDTDCNICKRVRHIEHTYDNACDKECNICGNKRETEHKYDGPCDADCNICGHVREITHSFANELHAVEGGHFRICSVCGARDEIQPHTSSSPATETEPEVCDGCGYIIAAALGHKEHTPEDVWQRDETKHYRRCTGCPLVMEEAEHVYDDECDSDCNVCGYIREAPHSYGDWVTDEDGHRKVCSCGKIAMDGAHVGSPCEVCGYEKDAVSTETGETEAPAPDTDTAEGETGGESAVTEGDRSDTEEASATQSETKGEDEDKKPSNTLVIIAAIGIAVLAAVGVTLALVLKKKK